jgi:surface antigen
MLMAFADNELDAVERARVVAYLQSSTDGLHRFDVFAATGRRLADLFDQPMHEPVPQHLIDAVTAEPVIHLQEARLVREQRSAQSRQRSSYSYMALAASLTALAVGASGFWLLKGASPTDANYGLAISETGERLAADVLGSALETVASGTKVTSAIAGSAATIEPVFTFATASSGYCRQYIIRRSTEIAFGGVACRTTGGQWRIEAHQAFTPKPAKDNQIVPAGNDSLRSIDTIVDSLISGDVLSGDAEASVMTDGWKTLAP